MRPDPDSIETALELTAIPGDISVEAHVNAWDKLREGAGAYVRLVQASDIRPVGRGLIGEAEETRPVWFCETHGWASEERLCYYPVWYRRNFKPWRWWGKRRKAKKECSIVPRLLVGVESFE